MLTDNTIARPFVKWLGGKRQMLDQIKGLMPKSFNDYYEPFLGGGAVYLELIKNTHKAILNDFNSELISTYKRVRDNPDKLIKHLKYYDNLYNKQTSQDMRDQIYYFLRKNYNGRLEKCMDDLEMSALFIFLNKASFNGVYRVNKHGLYNVPTGHKKHVTSFKKDNIKAVSQKLQNAGLYAKDYKQIISYFKPKKHDFVFFDPPYFNTFIDYQQNGFDEDEQKKLADIFDKLTKKHVYCILTNSNTKFIKNLYSQYNIHVLNVRRYINRNAKNRKGQEVIITNY